MTLAVAAPSAPDLAVLLPELQGRRTDFALALSVRSGRLFAKAEWFTEDPRIKRFCTAQGSAEIAGLLTAAAWAVKAGLA